MEPQAERAYLKGVREGDAEKKLGAARQLRDEIDAIRASATRLRKVLEILGDTDGMVAAQHIGHYNSICEDHVVALVQKLKDDGPTTTKDRGPVIISDDGKEMREGDRAFSVYTMTWGIIKNVKEHPTGETIDPRRDLWFDFVQENGKTDYLNGQRIGSYKPGWVRS